MPLKSRPASLIAIFTFLIAIGIALFVASPPHLAESLRLSGRTLDYFSEAAPQNGGVASINSVSPLSGKPEAYRDVLRQSRDNSPFRAQSLSWRSDRSWMYAPAHADGTEIFSRFFATRNARMISLVRLALLDERRSVPMAASDAVPILYYDFENNTTRTTFENLVEQAVNSGSGAITRAGNTTTISGVSGAGTFNGGAASGQAATGSNWSSSTTDLGILSTDYYQFVVNTSGFSGISVTFDQQASATGPARVGLLYSTDGLTYNATTTALTGNAAFGATTFDLTGIAAVDNQSSVTIRLYAFAGSASDRTGRSAFGSGGTFRIDNLTVRASTVTASKTLLDYPAIGLSIKSGTAFTPSYGDFTVNGAGITVTLASVLQLSGTLNLNSGKVTTTSSNLLTVTNAASNAISGGSSTSYVNGPLSRVLPASLASGSTFSFPVGKSGYNPFELVNPTTTAGGTVTFQAEEFDGNSGGTAGTGLASLNTDRYWGASITSGAANFTNTTVKLTNSSALSASNRIGKSSTANGTYNSIGGSVSGSTITSDPISSFSFFVIGTLSGNTISGTVFDVSGNPITTGRTIKLIQNGTVSGTTVTSNGSGVYTFTGITLANGDRIATFIDGASEKGVTVTVSGNSPADITNFDIRDRQLTVRTDNGATSITNSNLADGDSSHDSDIPFTVSGGTLTTTTGTSLQINFASTYAPGGNINVSGDWINNNAFTAGSNTVTFNGVSNQNVRGLNATTFATLTVNNTGATNDNIVLLDATLWGTPTLTVGTLNVLGGVFDQGFGSSSADLVTTGAGTVASVSAGATWRDLGKGDLTLSGDVSNSGTINFNSNGSTCGDPIDILIRSSVNGTKRTWSGTGTFSMIDVNVKDQKVPTVPPPAAILVNSGTDAGGNTGWVFVSQCTSGTYTWVGGTVGAATDWQVPTNWNPNRITPASSDILIFDGNSTPAPTVTNVPSQGVGALRLKNSVNPVTLNAAGTNTLTFSAATGSDLDIPNGTALTLAGANALTLSLTGATGGGPQATIAGQLIFQDGAHSLIGSNSGEIKFASGSIFTTTTGHSGFPFGSGSGGIGVPGSIEFQSGASAFFGGSTGDPFGTTVSPVTTFDLGSTETFYTSTALSYGNRSYGNLILDGNQAYTGGSTSSMLTVQNNFTLANGSTFTLSSSSGGDLNLLGNFTDSNPNANALDPNGRTVKFQGGSLTQTVSKATIAESFFDVFISETAGGKVQLLSPLTITGQLNLSTADSLLELNGKTLTLNGTITGTGNLKGDSGAALSVGGTGALGTLNFLSSFRTLSSMTVNRTTSGSVTLGTDLTITSSLTLINGVVNTGSNTLSLNSAATVTRTNGYVIGNLKKTFSANGSFTFPVGTANGYSPLDTTVTSGTGNLTAMATQSAQSTLDSAHSLHRYWTLTATGITANLVFHYLAGDVFGTEANYRIIRVSGSTATSFPNACPSAPCVDTSAKTATINGVNSFSDWTLGEPINPTATDSIIGGHIADSNGNPVEGVGVRITGTQSRLTVSDAQGNYRFDNVETNGFYTVTPSRANFTFSPAQRSFSQLGLHTDATFTAESSGDKLNPLDQTEYFVRQQYVDFLNREPDEAGLTFWVKNIESCGDDAQCREVKRIDTSAAFFLSIEFQQTGYLVYRVYKSAYGNTPGAPVPLKLSEFKPDTRAIGNGVVVNQEGWQEQLENNKQAYLTDFAQRVRFTGAYPTTMAPAEFVDKLFANAGVTPADADRNEAIDEFGSAPTTADTATRARVLRRVAENSSLAQKQFNQAFVLMEYFGYLRRDPNSAPDTNFDGYGFWLNKLDFFNGNYQNAEMVNAFLTSLEYRGRFPR